MRLKSTLMVVCAEAVHTSAVTAATRRKNFPVTCTTTPALWATERCDRMGGTRIAQRTRRKRESKFSATNRVVSALRQGVTPDRLRRGSSVRCAGLKTAPAKRKQTGKREKRGGGRLRHLLHDLEAGEGGIVARGYVVERAGDRPQGRGSQSREEHVILVSDEAARINPGLVAVWEMALIVKIVAVFE